ncbi:MAG: hypothetical protein HOE90_06745 [Bacteriovoracaceae bacterium]|mgnify:CR=1 FL=1|jgi:hypothetical protein|nr:hypothetical protein [Bacteriovoracaceae bacterium]
MKNAELIPVSAKESPLFRETKMKRYHFSLLTPDRVCPCSIYVYFRGKYIEAVKREGIVALELMAKMYHAQNYFFYVLEDEDDLFRHWIKARHSIEFLPMLEVNEKNKVVEFKTSNYIKAALASIHFSEENASTKRFLKSAHHKLKQVVCHPSLKWFFESEWEKETIEHTSRVAFMMLLYLEFQEVIAKTLNPFELIQACIIHHLDGELSSYREGETYHKTLSYLTSKNHIVSENVCKILGGVNEFHNGSGKPKALKRDDLALENQLLSVVDYFDHFRKSNNQLTRSKALANTKVEMVSKKALFNPSMLKGFMMFLDLIEIKT